MLFSLRFQSQLRRTKPETTAALEKLLIDTVKRTGSKIRMEYRCFTASLAEEKLGLWLNIVLILEEFRLFLKQMTADFYGYACLLGRDNELGENGAALVRLLPVAGLTGSGIWCTPYVRQALDFYADFENVPWNRKEFFQINNFHSFSRDLNVSYYPFGEKIQDTLKQNPDQNVVLIGPDFMGKREEICRFYRQSLGDFPPLLVRFGSGGTGIACLWDALSGPIRSVIAEKNGGVLAELDALGIFLARERLGKEFSPYVLEKADRFFRLLLEIYSTAAMDRGLAAVLVLEDLHLANPETGNITAAACHALGRQYNLFIYGTCSGRPPYDVSSYGGYWEPLFHKVLRFTPDDFPARYFPELPEDLWEIAYAAFLFRRFFPGSLLADLFEEEGENPVMVSKALDMLLSLGVIDCTGDPLPRIYDFRYIAETRLGNRKEKIHAMVRNRLLAWAAAGKFRYCFNLLRILAELRTWRMPKQTSNLSPELILDTFKADLANETYGDLQKAIDESQLELIVTEPEQIPALRYIFRTLGSLLHGTEEEIRRCFTEPPPACTVPVYEVQIGADRAAFCLGIHDTKTASTLVKGIMVNCHNTPAGKILSRVYRLFALANLSGKRLGEALEYFSFAAEKAEKSKDFDELGINAYYTAGGHFLHGNIAKAERLALQAEQAACRAGRVSWADRARFLRGKLRFELGHYRDALELFEGLRNNPMGILSADAEQVLDAWIYRSRIYQNDWSAAVPGGTCRDALFFEIEAAYLEGDYQRALDFAERFLAELPLWGQDIPDRNSAGPELFLFVEQPDWRSGFSQCELYLLPQKNFWGPLISAYRNLALCRVGQPGTAFGEEARQNMRRIIQDGRLSEMDPNNAFFFYAWYCVLEESGAEMVDMNTAVSMAFKRLQSRASRIDDPDIWSSFLNLHYWNSALGEAAKKHKLI
jgi:hypothetical protein